MTIKKTLRVAIDNVRIISMIINKRYRIRRFRNLPKQHLNIACISYYLPPHDRIGAGYQMHYTANAYIRAGHKVTMFSPYDVPAEDALYHMVRVPVGLHNRTFRFAWNMRKQDFSRFDLLHAAGDDYWLTGKKRPYHVRTIHGSCFAEMMNVHGARDRFRMFLLGLSEVASSFVADRAVVVSHNTTRYMPWIRDVVWNGVDLEIFKPGAAKSSQPSILFVGTMHSRKRGAELLDIFQREIRAVLPDAELWIVREDKPVEAPGVRWFGSVSLEKLVELYQSAWVFCLPSSYEGFGVPYIEAMACGTPTVATPNLGALEVLEKGRYGVVADLPELGNALLKLLQNPQERKKFEQLGLERVQIFAWENVVNAYLELPTARGEHNAK